MKIRVAYDIALLGHSSHRPDSKHGIARVYEEVLFELSKRDDVDLTAVAVGGEDPLGDSLSAGLYFEAHGGRVRGRFARSYTSRLGLTEVYEKVYRACHFEGMKGEEAKRGLRSMLMWRARGLLHRLHNGYGVDRLRNVFDAASYDVYHSPFTRLPPESLTKGVPRVLTVYDLIPLVAPEYVEPHTTGFLKKILDTVNVERDWVTCISQHTKDAFCEYTGMSPERAFVTPLAASSNFHPVEDAGQVGAVRRRYGVPAGGYLLSVAAPQPRKNLAHLIRCFFRLLDERPGLDVNLVLAGSKGQGWLYDDIFAAAESSAAHRERVAFTGFVADEDMAALYAGASAFVFPSLYEGFGLPPLEAMACGTPVISSDTTALPEVVGGAGLLVGPKDEDALCQAMLDVLTDGGLRADLRRRGLERAAEFSWRRCAAQTVEAYRAAAAEKESA